MTTKDPGYLGKWGEYDRASNIKPSRLTQPASREPLDVQRLEAAMARARADLIGKNAWAEGRELPLEYRSEWGDSWPAAIAREYDVLTKRASQPASREPRSGELTDALRRIPTESDWVGKFYAALDALYMVVKDDERPAMGTPPHIVMADLIDDVAWASPGPDLRAMTEFEKAAAIERDRQWSEMKPGGEEWSAERKADAYFMACYDRRGLLNELGWRSATPRTEASGE